MYLETSANKYTEIRVYPAQVQIHKIQTYHLGLPHASSRGLVGRTHSPNSHTKFDAGSISALSTRGRGGCRPEGGCIALYDVWRVWLYGCKAVCAVYAVYPDRRAVTMRAGCIRMKYSQILYTLLYGEVMYRPPRWTVFETFERLSPR